jgi:hypothetical protein
MTRRNIRFISASASAFAEGIARKMASVAWLKVLKTFGLICALSGVCIGFWLLDRYRRKVEPVEAAMGPLKLVDPPTWLNEDLKLVIRRTVMPGGVPPNLDERAAGVVAERLNTLAWLADVKVETAANGIFISARYRKPLAIVEVPSYHGQTKYYLSKDMMVLDYVPLETLHIVKLTGVAASAPPDVGHRWDREDAAAAVDILAKLEEMDRVIAQQGHPPLLAEIKSIDVSNFEGRRDAKAAHIVLTASDGTQILWGARLGMSSRYMEANDYEKVAMLYEFFLKPRENRMRPTLLGRNVSYVELRIPRDTIPRPTVPPDAFQN